MQPDIDMVLIWTEMEEYGHFGRYGYKFPFGEVFFSWPSLILDIYNSDCTRTRDRNSNKIQTYGSYGWKKMGYQSNNRKTIGPIFIIYLITI